MGSEVRVAPGQGERVQRGLERGRQGGERGREGIQVAGWFRRHAEAEVKLESESEGTAPEAPSLPSSPLAGFLAPDIHPLLASPYSFSPLSLDRQQTGHLERMASSTLQLPPVVMDKLQPDFHQVNLDIETFIKNDLQLKLDKGSFRPVSSVRASGSRRLGLPLTHPPLACSLHCLRPLLAPISRSHR